MIAPRDRRNDRGNGLLLATVPGVNGAGEAWIIATNTRRASGNRKTGDCIQIWSIPTAGLYGTQSHVCGSCPLLPAREGGEGGCYVSKLHLTHIARSAAAGHYEPWDGDTSLFRPQFVRFGAWGDPCLLPLALVERIAGACRGWTGYTHEWRRPANQEHRRFFMASIHTEAEAREAEALRWRWFAAPFAGDDPTTWTTHAAQCPHQSSQGRIQCRDCGLCDGTASATRPSIYNLPHGPKNVVSKFNR